MQNVLLITYPLARRQNPHSNMRIDNEAPLFKGVDNLARAAHQLTAAPGS